MAEGVQGGLVQASQVARDVTVRQSANGVRYAVFGDAGLDEAELARMVQAVPSSMAAALARKIYYFVPLALAEGRSGEAGHRSGNESTMIAPEYTTELADLAICHRNVALGADGAGSEGVFISTHGSCPRSPAVLPIYCIGISPNLVRQALFLTAPGPCTPPKI